MLAVNPPVKLIRADPPGRRSIAASLPNQAPSPSAVVNAAHTPGRRVSELNGPLDPVRKSHDRLPQVATDWLPSYGNRMVASRGLLGRPPAGDGARIVAALSGAN